MGEASVYSWDELKCLLDGYWKMWAIYMQWFTWFFGLDLLSMSWIITAKDKPDGILVLGLAALWIFCTILGMVAAANIWRYTEGSKARMKELVAASGSNSAGAGDGFLAANVTDWGCKGTASALAATIFGWVFLVWRFWQ